MPDLFQLVCGAISVHEIKNFIGAQDSGEF